MIIMAIISYALPSMSDRPEEGTALGYWSFWLQIGNIFGMMHSFATAGIAQVYLERIMGLGYLDAQLKIPVHFLMLVATGSIFVTGKALFIIDFFRNGPNFDVEKLQGPEQQPALGDAA